MKSGGFTSKESLLGSAFGRGSEIRVIVQEVMMEMSRVNPKSNQLAGPGALVKLWNEGSELLMVVCNLKLFKNFSWYQNFFWYPKASW